MSFFFLISFLKWKIQPINVFLLKNLISKWHFSFSLMHLTSKEIRCMEVYNTKSALHMLKVGTLFTGCWYQPVLVHKISLCSFYPSPPLHLEISHSRVLHYVSYLPSRLLTAKLGSIVMPSIWKRLERDLMTCVVNARLWWSQMSARTNPKHRFSMPIQAAIRLNSIYSYSSVVFLNLLQYHSHKASLAWLGFIYSAVTLLSRIHVKA